jgi:phage baseplate assembly protein W
MAEEFLGVGWQYPVALNEDGELPLSEYEDSVRESIRIIIGTAPGERQMRPDFGCDIHSLVFAHNNLTTAGQAAYYVEKALIRWEPRIETLRVHAVPDQTEGNRLLIEIEYKVIVTNTIFNLVYPFYLIEGIAE